MKKIFLVLGVLLVSGTSGFGQWNPCDGVSNLYKVYFADPTCCNRYYECDNGVAIPCYCPEGLAFNSQTLVCDWPWNTDCGGGGSGCGSTTNGGGSSNPTCISGGIGASSCSIKAGVSVLGSGADVECSVSCYSGYYACCSYTCRCIPN